MRRLIGAGVAGAAAAAGWGLFEAGWVRLRELRCALAGLPDELDGLRIAHLSDFHLGVPSPGARAAEDAVAWVARRRPQVVCVTGDLLSHPRGRPRLQALLERVPGAYVVWGNHDFGIARDPFARRSAPHDVAPARLLADDSAIVEVGGRRVQVAGVDPRGIRSLARRAAALADADADLRVLLCHYPRIVDHLPPRAFHLVLAGHLHDGQITLPYVLGKVRLAHPLFPYPCGLYRRGGTTLHVSPGLGTTFVPFRFGARPEATELVLERV